jgi:hypothetical protein
MRGFLEVKEMARCDELDLGRVGRYMYQQITKRYVPLCCDRTVSRFYQRDQIQAYPSRPWIATRCLFSIKRGAARGASSTRVAPLKVSCLPNSVFLGPSGSCDYAI